jgi:UDP-2-acetamido-3-amino-2,3-dideoxy-glucuronate N-acetyltransferase
MRISYSEAIQTIEKDNAEFNLALLHRGFLSDGDYPFRMSEIINGVTLWPPVDIHPAAKIGPGTMVGRYTNIMGDVIIGERVRIQGFCYIPDCVEIGDRVFIGPGVIFTNVKRPKIRGSMMKRRDGKIVIHNDVSLGAGCIIGPGVEIASETLVGMGAVVTKDITERNTTHIGIPSYDLSKRRDYDYLLSMRTV